MCTNYFGTFYFTILQQHTIEYNEMYGNIYKYLQNPTHSIDFLTQSLLYSSKEGRRQTCLLLFHLSYRLHNIKDAFSYFIMAEEIDQIQHMSFNFENEESVRAYIASYRQKQQNEIKDWRYYLLLGQSYLERCLIDQAIQSLDKAIQIKKKCDAAYCDLARIYSTLEKFELAERNIKDAIQINPCSINYLLYGIILKDHGLYDKCIPILKKALQVNQFILDSKHCILGLLSMAYYQCGDFISALETAQQSILAESFAANSHPYQTKFLVLLKYQQYSQAKAIVQYWILKDPSNHKWLYHLGYLYQITNDYISAINTYKKKIALIKGQNQKEVCLFFKNKFGKNPSQIDNSYSNSCMGISRSYQCQKQYQKALKYSKLACQIPSPSTKAFGRTAVLQIQMGLESQALEYCQRMENMSLVDLEDHELLAKNYYNLKQYQKSCDYAIRCKELKTKDLQIAYILGKSYCILNKVNYAETQLLYAKKQDNQLAYLGLAEIQYGIKLNCEKCLEYSLKGLQIIQSKKDKYFNQHQHAFYYLYHSQILTQIGLVYYLLQFFDQAIKLLNEALMDFPKNYNATVCLGSIYQMRQLPEQQIKLYTRFKQQNPKNILIYIPIGKHYRCIKDYQTSLKYFQLFLSQSTLYRPQVLQEIGKVYFHLEDYQSSIKNYFESLQANATYTLCYLGLAKIYSMNILTQNIRKFIEQLKTRHIKEKQFMFMLHIYYKLIGQELQSADHYWCVVQPLVDQLQRQLSIDSSSQILPKLLKHYFLVKQYGAASQMLLVEYFFLHRLKDIKSSQTFSLSKQIIKLKTDREHKLSNFFIRNYHLTKNYNEKYRKKMYQFLLEQILGFDQKQGSIIYNFLLQSQYSIQYCFKDILMAVLRQKNNQIQDVCNILSNFTAKNAITFLAFDANHKYEIIRNIGIMSSLYRSLSDKNIEHILDLIQSPELQLSKIANQIIKTVRLPMSEYQQIYPTNDILLSIKRKINSIRKKIIQILRSFRQTNNKEVFIKQMLNILTLLLSKKFIKRQLIKFCWKNIHHLCKIYDSSLQVKIEKIFRQFLQQINYPLQTFGNSIKDIIIKDEATSSKISLSDITQLTRQDFDEEVIQKEEPIASVQKNEKIIMNEQKCQPIKGFHKNSIQKEQDEGEQLLQNKHKHEQSVSIPSEQQISKKESQTPQNSKMDSNKQDSSIIDKRLYKDKKIIVNIYTFNNLKKLFKVQAPFYYEKQIPPHQLKNHLKCLASILFKNTYDIMRYLSKKKLRLRFVAKYFIESNWCQQFASKKQLPFQMELGDSTYHSLKDKLTMDKQMRGCIIESNKIINRITIDGNQLEREQIKVAHYLWEKGAKEIIEYLLCIACGILELEENNIFQMDLELRNTIKLGSVYKIIDFDLALVYRKPESAGNRISICFENTLKIIKTLLSFDLKDAQENADLNKAVEVCLPGLSEAKYKQIRDLCGKQNSEMLVMAILQKHAYQFHRKQFNRLLCFLSVKEIIGKQFKKLNLYLNLFLNGKKSYSEAKVDLQRTFQVTLNDQNQIIHQIASIDKSSIDR